MPISPRPGRTEERIAAGSDADERVLVHLRGLGWAPGTPLRVAHFLYVPDHAGADAVAHSLDDDGWATSLEPCADTSWLVVATRMRPLTPALVRSTRRRLETLALRHGGVYDGWEAAAG
jgi:regulator of ribonuclease activity B